MMLLPVKPRAPPLGSWVMQGEGVGDDVIIFGLFNFDGGETVNSAKAASGGHMHVTDINHADSLPISWLSYLLTT